MGSGADKVVVFAKRLSIRSSNPFWRTSSCLLRLSKPERNGERCREDECKAWIPTFCEDEIHSSNKHDWVDSCCLKSANPKAVLDQLANIVGYQGFSPYPVSPSLLIRQMLEAAPAFHAFNGMPMTQEFRFFASKGKSSDTRHIGRLSPSRTQASTIGSQSLPK